MLAFNEIMFIFTFDVPIIHLIIVYNQYDLLCLVIIK